MPSPIAGYLAGRPDAPTFLLPDFDRTLEELFPKIALPEPMKIFPADETLPPLFGFPLVETTVIKDLDAKLDRWLTDEVQYQLTRGATQKEKAQVSFSGYVTPLMRVAENALLSNVLGDYHGVFWLAHSFDLAKQFASIPRRISIFDTQAGRAQGDSLKYRIVARWVADTR